jgi:hypothetical protein
LSGTVALVQILLVKFFDLFKMMFQGIHGAIGEQGDSAFSTVGISDDQLRLRKVDVFDPALQDFSKS